MGEERCYTVYMHICKISLKTYIGITRTKPEVRWKNGKGYIDNEYFTRAINKHGWNEGFEHIILFENKTKTEAEKLEILFIKVLLSSNRDYGYNISLGGNSIGKHSEETRQKLSESHIGLQAGKDNGNSKKIICDSKEFDCIKDCSRYYNVDYEAMLAWLDGRRVTPKIFIDMNLKYANEKTNLKTRSEIEKQVVCDEIIYNSIKDFCEYYGVNTGNASSWLNERVPMPKFFYYKQFRFLGEDLTNNFSEYGMDVICDGEWFESISKCAIKYGINPNVMRSWLNCDSKMPQNFIDLGLQYFGKENVKYEPQSDISPKAKKVICDGVVFDSIISCSDRYGVHKDTLRQWINGTNKMPKEFADLGLRYFDDDDTIYQIQEQPRKRKVICDGKTFETVKDCATFYNISRRKMNGWLLKNRMPQKFIDLGLRYLDDNMVENTISLKQISFKGKNNPNSKKVICDNQIFGCIKDCADYYGLNYSTLKDWLQNKYNMKKEFKDLGLAYYIEETVEKSA